MATVSEVLAAGLAHFRAGRLDRAAQIYAQVLAFDPDQPDALYLQGLIDHQCGRNAIAAERLARAIAANPANPAYRTTLGLARLALGQPVVAAGHFVRALAFAPAEAHLHGNLALAHRHEGAIEAAAAHYAHACELAPDDVPLLLVAANTENAAGRRAQAVQLYRRALVLEPDSADAAAGLGATLLAQSQIETGMAALHRALALTPAAAAMHNDLAVALQAQGELARAASHYRRALDLDSGFAVAHMNLLFCLNYDADQDCDTLFAAYQDWERRHARAGYAQIRSHGNRPDPDRPLRIGYLSADFRASPIGSNIEGLIAHHDGAQFAAYCYAQVPREDGASRHFRDIARAWRPIHGLSDAEAAEAIRADRIDILVSLGGHTGENRVLICAYKPAPILASYGDLSTTGLATVDYWLTDPVLHPPGSRERFTEQLWHLPLLVVHRPPAGADGGADGGAGREAGDVTAVPSPGAGRIMFASFNNPAKITAPTIALWARILNALPNSALMLHFYDVFASPGVCRRFIERFAAHGVDPVRLVFEGGALERAAHIDLYARVDVALDPFPFTGCTTTFEALWMGVPVVALAGERWLGRMSAGILVPAGLGDLVTADADAYFAKAVELAGDVDRRRMLRAGLRRRLLDSPLCDHQSYARAVEAAYRAMWRKWCEAHGDRR
jgi:predicted O-linked N-acetylglucosamine transferase (SPINDLY family)